MGNQAGCELTGLREGPDRARMSRAIAGTLCTREVASNSEAAGVHRDRGTPAVRILL